MSGPSQLQLQEERDNLKADIQQAKQELHDAEATGDEKAVAFWRKQLELLGELELILLWAQPTGQLHSPLSPTKAALTDLTQTPARYATG